MNVRMSIFGRERSLPDKHALSFVPRGATRQSGAIAIMSVGLLILLIGFFALAIDLSRIFNRRAEMHALSSTVALAAAKHLDGTSGGIALALDAARDVVEGQTTGPYYEYKNTMTWSDGAMTFSASRDGSTGWKTSADATGSPDGLMYVKVDTSALNVAYGRVRLLFAPVISSSLASVDIGDHTIAGKSRLNVTPLGICAMSPTARSKRTSPSGTSYDELVEYGFRRGITYDLMQLNPNGAAPASFKVDPVSLADSGSSSANFTQSIYEQYICSGTVGLPKVAGARVGVQATFPIGTYYTHLNSRFDSYTGTCDVHSSPPDSNVKSYTFGTISWMNPKAGFQHAVRDTTATTRLQTVADLGPSNHSVAADYGPLWSFARAIPWASYESQGVPEPPGGYTPFAATTTVWQALYGATSGAGTYPGTVPNRSPNAEPRATPYFQFAGGSSYYVAPTSSRKPGTPDRRVLNIPLLSCPVTGAEADVLAIGKFFMTVPATSAAIYAEFGGISTDGRTGGLVEIYR